METRNNQDSSRQARSRRSAGFTLAELMVATAVMGLVGACLAQFSLSTSRVLFDSTATIHMSSDVSMFTSRISRDGLTARSFYIYPTFGNNQSINNRVRDGGTGDLLVFVWIAPQVVNGVPNYDRFYYTRIVGYGRTAGENGYGPVVRFERTFPQIEAYRTSAISVEGVLSQALSGGNPPVPVVELARGLASQNLFYNLRDNSIIINGEILQGNDARSVTNTYNFSVTPRG